LKANLAEVIQLHCLPLSLLTHTLSNSPDGCVTPPTPSSTINLVGIPMSSWVSLTLEGGEDFVQVHLMPADVYL
jgi:hypothetical protein